MAKLTAWLVTLVGVLWLAGPMGFAWITGSWISYLMGLSFLVMGIGKLMRNYGKRKR